jgi:hypothetical protein
MFAFLSRKPSPKLLERLESLEGTMNILELQMEELKALYRRAIARIGADNRDGVERTEAVLPAPMGPSHGLLSPRQYQLQQEILKRRAGG